MWVPEMETEVGDMRETLMGNLLSKRWMEVQASLPISRPPFLFFTDS